MPSSAAAVKFDRRHATWPCLRVPTEEIEIVDVADSTPQASNLTIDGFASSSSLPTNRGINIPNKISEASVEATYEQGYDSDGELLILGDMEFERIIMEEYNEFVATELTDDSYVPKVDQPSLTRPATTSDEEFVFISDEEIDKL